MSSNSPGRDPGIVAEDIHPVELAVYVLAETLHLESGGDIHHLCVYRDAVAFQLLRCSPQSIRVQVRKGQGSPPAGEGLGDGLTCSAGRPGDHHHSVTEVLHPPVSGPEKNFPLFHKIPARPVLAITLLRISYPRASGAHRRGPWTRAPGTRRSGSRRRWSSRQPPGCPPRP